jgi:signal transduction histidine kinase
LSNATKFTDRGGFIRVNISSGTDKVVIRIKDTGTGIPQDKLDCIFERFQQVETTLTRNHEGSGIGLSLVKSLVEKHNGKISVKSELGKGTDFMIELPCKPKQDIGSTALKDYACVKNSVEKINVEFSDIYL